MKEVLDIGQGQVRENNQGRKIDLGQGLGKEVEVKGQGQDLETEVAETLIGQVIIGHQGQ